MVNVWIHTPGGTAPYLLTEMEVDACSDKFDLDDATYLRPLGDQPPEAPPALGDDPEVVVFEVLQSESTDSLKTGFYASGMSADTVRELIGEE
jgi:hypothetical protein